MTFESSKTMLICWLILGKIYYHYEATDFLEPITAEKYGEDMYEDYCAIIDPRLHMDITTVMERVKSFYYLRDGNEYRQKEEFKKDIL